MICNCFYQVGMSLPVDSSEDQDLSVKVLPDLVVGDWNRELVDSSHRNLGNMVDVMENLSLTELEEDFEINSLGDDDECLEYVQAV